MSFMKDFDHLKIQMKDIVSATNNFDPAKVIGCGGFGKVYKGELSLPEEQITVAFKKLDRRLGQGNIEFWKEIMMLSKYKHENLISLMHFCIEGDEMILVYEYASRGSLDRYLSDASTLTWIQRLRICVGAARGLHYLHDPMETQQRVLHRDIKSGNILLDEKWTAKVSDFGLSKIGPANQAHSYLVSNVVGTPGYCDPLYLELGFLSKESDVYSFGVVLFEILCGRLCFEYSDGKLTNLLVPKWKRCYEEKRLDEIILVGLKEQMDPGSLNSFSAIAYRCVKRAREERPTMAEVVKELEFSLEQQDILENPGNKVDFAELIRIAKLEVRPLSKPIPQIVTSEVPESITVELNVNMHCEACALQLKSKILRMKGVGTVETEVSSSKVIVTGSMDSEKLVEYVHRRMKKHAKIVPQPEPKPEPAEKPKEDEKPEEKRAEEAKPEEKPAKEEKKEGGDSGDGKEEEKNEKGEKKELIDMQRMMYYYHQYPPPPQLFSDENPNASPGTIRDAIARRNYVANTNFRRNSDKISVSENVANTSEFRRNSDENPNASPRTIRKKAIYDAIARRKYVQNTNSDEISESEKWQNFWDTFPTHSRQKL